MGFLLVASLAHLSIRLHVITAAFYFIFSSSCAHSHLTALPIKHWPMITAGLISGKRPLLGTLNTVMKNDSFFVWTILIISLVLNLCSLSLFSRHFWNDRHSFWRGRDGIEGGDQSQLQQSQRGWIAGWL
jgi:hypothetical protein